AFVTQPVVKTVDAFGNFSIVGLGASVPLTLTLQSGTGTLAGTVSADVGTGGTLGVATFTDLQIDTAGAKTLRASATLGGPVMVDSASFTIGAGAASALVFTTEPSGATAGAAFVTQPVVKTVDAFGNLSTVGLAASVPLTMTVQSGSGTLVGTVSIDIDTDETLGVTTFTDLQIDAAGAKILRASATLGGVVTMDSASFTVVPDVAHHLAFLAQPTDAVAGATQAASVEVEIFDLFGNRVTTATDTVALAFGTNPSSATLGGTTSLAAVAGVATFPGLTVSAAGNDYTLVASSGVLTNSTSATFDIVAAGGTGHGHRGSSGGGGCGLGSAASFAALMMMLLMVRLRSGRRSDHHV
ncbi:MAG TPA: hypothetical protein VHX44_18740, partial [Planctomycetota bacterium]|nr:hypothetical protein [Planctomycetota bacterium]